MTTHQHTWFQKYSALNRSCNATVKAEVTRFLTLTNQSSASILWCRPTRDQNGLKIKNWFSDSWQICTVTELNCYTLFFPHQTVVLFSFEEATKTKKKKTSRVWLVNVLLPLWLWPSHASLGGQKIEKMSTLSDYCISGATAEAEVFRESCFWSDRAVFDTIGAIMHTATRNHG